jgi:hypothetical protein
MPAVEPADPAVIPMISEVFEMLLARLSTPVDGIPAWRFAVRLLVVAVELYLVVCLGERGVLFFYQAF